MSDETLTEEIEEEVEESIMVDESQEVEANPSSEQESKNVFDATTPLPASEYLNPPERNWVLPTFLGMFVVYFGYYWFTYLGTL